jgi:hypothetical protein
MAVFRGQGFGPAADVSRGRRSSAATADSRSAKVQASTRTLDASDTLDRASAATRRKEIRHAVVLAALGHQSNPKSLRGRTFTRAATQRTIVARIVDRLEARTHQSLTRGLKPTSRKKPGDFHRLAFVLDSLANSSGWDYFAPTNWPLAFFRSATISAWIEPGTRWYLANSIVNVP